MLAYKDPRHGTYAGWKQGCRLECCRAPKAQSKRDWRARIRAVPLAADSPLHGRESTYDDYACRCRRCTDAKMAARKVRADPLSVTSVERLRRLVRAGQVSR